MRNEEPTRTDPPPVLTGVISKLTPPRRSGG